MTLRRLFLLLPVAAAGCSFFQGIGLAPNEPDAQAVSRVTAPDEPPRVVVQQILVSFEGSPVPGVTRTKDEAKRLAEKVLDMARGGRDFAELVRLYSDDRAGDGRYAMANWGVPTEGDEVERQKMVRGFGAAAFSLPVGGIVLVEYDKTASPLGWHVVKRTR